MTITTENTISVFVVFSFLIFFILIILCDFYEIFGIVVPKVCNCETQVCFCHVKRGSKIPRWFESSYHCTGFWKHYKNVYLLHIAVLTIKFANYIYVHQVTGTVFLIHVQEEAKISNTFGYLQDAGVLGGPSVVYGRRRRLDDRALHQSGLLLSIGLFILCIQATSANSASR